MDPNSQIFPEPPQWSLNVGTAGQVFVYLAIAAFIVSAAGWLFAPRFPMLRTIGARSFTAGSVFLFGTFISLAVLFVANRLEYEYVWSHGDGSNTVPYRIAGIWAGQQGSFLLWACCSAVFGLLAVRGTGDLRRWFTVPYATFLAGIAGILAYETPFHLNMVGGKPVVPATGIGLSPSLQNYWVTIHPPTIFLGFGALTVLAAYAFSAMASNKVNEWAPMVRPWAIVALSLVGVGLCMGGFWAYETLGWGGFWMWDPVENVSFVPWVFTAALVHGLIVQVVKNKWAKANLLLGGLPFLIFVYGTFLTRSGALNETSVHSFAEMNGVAHKLLLGFLGFSTAGFVALWIWRMGKMKKAAPSIASTGVNREGMYLLGATLLIVLGVGAAIGMSMPLIMSLMGKPPKVVEEGLYHKTLTWAYIPLMLAMAIGPLTAWRGMGALQFMNRIFGVLSVTILITGALMVTVAMSPSIKSLPPDAVMKMPFGLTVGAVPWVLLLVSLSVAVVVANVWRITELFKRSKLSSAAFLAHVGVAVLMTGLVVSRGFEQQNRVFVADGTRDTGLGYSVSYKGQTSDRSDRNNKVLFQLTNASESWTATPGLYYVQGEDGKANAMVWPYIKRHLLYDVYFALQPPFMAEGQEAIMSPNETRTVDGFEITYLRRTSVGQSMQPGNSLGVVFRVKKGDRVMELNPTIEITQKGVALHPAAFDPQVSVTLKQLDAASKCATIQMGAAHEIYPVAMFYKPLTIFVWLGAAIIGIAGMMSAWYRRPTHAALAAKARLDADV